MVRGMAGAKKEIQRTELRRRRGQNYGVFRLDMVQFFRFSSERRRRSWRASEYTSFSVAVSSRSAAVSSAISAAMFFIGSRLCSASYSLFLFSKLGVRPRLPVE